MSRLIAVVAVISMLAACSSGGEESPTATDQWDDVSFDDPVPDATEHSVGDLQTWYDELHGELLTVPGVVYTDVQEAGAWIEVGAYTDKARQQLREIFDRHGIPETAYRIRFQEPGQDDDG